MLEICAEAYEGLLAKYLFLFSEFNQKQYTYEGKVSG
jgi:hypothetical protein